jgi:hypothetical protein
MLKIRGTLTRHRMPRRPELQILGAIVVLDPVDMVNALVGLEVATEGLLHDEAMLEAVVLELALDRRVVRTPDEHVALPVCPAVFPPVASLAARRWGDCVLKPCGAATATEPGVSTIGRPDVFVAAELAGVDLAAEACLVGPVVPPLAIDEADSLTLWGLHSISLPSLSVGILM